MSRPDLSLHNQIRSPRPDYSLRWSDLHKPPLSLAQAAIYSAGALAMAIAGTVLFFAGRF